MNGTIIRELKLGGYERQLTESITFPIQVAIEKTGAEAIPDGSADIPVPLVAPVDDDTQIKLIWIESDQDLTIGTNDAVGGEGSPDDTIELKAGVPLVWTPDCYLGIPFTTAITAGIFVSNPGATAANLVIYIGWDNPDVS